LTVTRTDVGDGWWEGTNSRGQSGLFPEGYVEPITTNTAASSFGQSTTPSYNDNWAAQPEQEYHDNEEAWDDDWDDDEDSQASTSAGDVGSAVLPPSVGFNPGLTGANRPVHAVVQPKASSGGVKKSSNILSPFMKSGADDYILGAKNKSVPGDMQVFVIEVAPGIYKWAPNQHPYGCQLASPKKESKLKGLKSFIAYQLTPSFNAIQVSRRYKHFDWLYARLYEKFIGIPIPPLPDKQISGRYQEDFIRHRLAQLQLWVDRICRHPVLAQSDVWMHFMTCTDEKRWKQGKRKAEKDEFVGSSFYYSIEAPQDPLDTMIVDKRVEHFYRFTVKMDEAVKHLHQTAQDQSKKYSGPYSKEFTRISNAFTQLADAFAGSGVPNEDRALNECIRATSGTYDSIGKMYEKQPINDYEPMSDVLYEYKGLLSHWPDILQLHRGAVNKKREHQKLQDEGKVDPSTTQTVYRKVDNVSYATLAEIDYFQGQRVSEFKEMIQNFLREQITFYEKITNVLRENLEKYERL
jgi:sorting nexin-9/18/33